LRPARATDVFTALSRRPAANPIAAPERMNTQNAGENPIPVAPNAPDAPASMIVARTPSLARTRPETDELTRAPTVDTRST
jgi:hypothetical protein